MHGIYIIKNTINNKVYIGQSVDLENRFKEHKKELHAKRHHNPHLQNAWYYYGEDKFEFSILEETTINELNDKEKEYIKLYKATDPKYGYNKQDGGSNGKLTEEIKLKISNSHKGKSKYWLKGRKRPEEVIEKIRATNKIKHKGKVLTRETKAKMSAKRRGELNASAKLTNNQVLEIFQRALNGEDQTNLAKEFNTSQQNISRIKSGAIWGHVTGKTYEKQNNKRLTAKQAKEIFLQIKLGKSIEEVCKDFSITKSVANGIKYQTIWKKVTSELDK